MNRDEALSFLRSHQPLPPDRELTQEMIDTFDEARRFFLDHPDPECIRAFLNSFGDGDGLGVYQLVGDVLRRLPKHDVVRELIGSLKSVHRSVRYWSAQLAAEFPSPDLVPHLLALLKEDDYDLKYAALTAMEQSGNSDVVPHLVSFSTHETDDELRSLATEVAESLRDSVTPPKK